MTELQPSEGDGVSRSDLKKIELKFSMDSETIFSSNSVLINSYYIINHNIAICNVSQCDFVLFSSACVLNSSPLVPPLFTFCMFLLKRYYSTISALRSGHHITGYSAMIPV